MPINHDEITQSKIESYVSLTNKTVLEIGCGDGRVTRFLSGPPALLVAFDPDLSRLDEAKQTAPAARYLSASGLALPFADSTFDLVFFTLSLHHHPDCAAALSEAARVLRSGGRALVLEPKDEGELEQICNIFNDEGPVLSAAQSAIDNSPLRVVASEVFTTEWHLGNAQALVDWLFAHYDVRFDQSMANQVLGMLGEKVEHVPLILADETIITCLKK